MLFVLLRLFEGWPMEVGVVEEVPLSVGLRLEPPKYWPTLGVTNQLEGMVEAIKPLATATMLLMTVWMSCRRWIVGWSVMNPPSLVFAA